MENQNWTMSVYNVLGAQSTESVVGSLIFIADGYNTVIL